MKMFPLDLPEIVRLLFLDFDGHLLALNESPLFGQVPYMVSGNNLLGEFRGKIFRLDLEFVAVLPLKYLPKEMLQL